MQSPLIPLLSRWDVEPPQLLASEIHGSFKEAIAAFNPSIVIRGAASAGSADCPDCSRRCRVDFIQDKSGQPRGYIYCPDCGLAEATAESLARWEVSTDAMLEAIFCGHSLAIVQRVPGQLWQVGKANWSGRSREIWFARAFRRGKVDAAIQVLSRRPKSILFTPTEVGAEQWRECTQNLVIALESTLVLCDATIGFDSSYVEGRIVDAGLSNGATDKRQSKKRADRAVNIERLKQEVISHLRAARDHAYATKVQTGEPELLARPTQKALAERVGLTESVVSRCMNDPAARELTLYWDTALDLDKIMSWTGPITKGPKA
ncbi:MAG: hypothetical protein KF847_08225 [Pirellulales bacterium]|nr:hypothetical protein [Pirellulales bacterium]